jgi:hypothetical protein
MTTLEISRLQAMKVKLKKSHVRSTDQFMISQYPAGYHDYSYPPFAAAGQYCHPAGQTHPP